jgi:site-specific recombinase XerD
MKAPMRMFQRRGWWYAGFRRGQEKALGTKDETLAAAIYKELETEYLRGKLFHLESYKKITLNEFQKTYIEEGRAGIATKTVRQDKLSLRLLMEVIGGTIQIRAVSAAKIDDFKRACLARKVKPTSVNSYLRHIKSALTYALDTGFIDKKPKIKAVKVGKSLPHVLSPDQIKSLLAKALETDVELWRYFMFCLWTGARRDEVRRLTWQAISIQNRQCRVIGKGDKERIVPLMLPVIEILEPIKRDVGHVFPQMHADTYTHKFKKIATACGITAYHLHDLRHTAATFMLKNGVPLPVVQKILGHKEISTTQIYAEVLDEMMQIEMAKLKFE